MMYTPSDRMKADFSEKSAFIHLSGFLYMPRLAGERMTCLESGALVFLASGGVATAGGGGQVFFALHIAGDGVAAEGETTGVQEGFKVTRHPVVGSHNSAGIFLKLDAATEERPGDTGTTTLEHLNAAGAGAIAHNQVAGLLALDINGDDGAAVLQSPIPENFGSSYAFLLRLDAYFQ